MWAEIKWWAGTIAAGIGLLIPTLIIIVIALVPTALLVTVIVLLWRHFG